MSFPPIATASGVDLLLACPASATFPTVQDAESPEVAARGTAEHAERLRLGELPEKVRRWFGADPRFEIAAAGDVVPLPETTPQQRFLLVGYDIGRTYPDFERQSWICGSADAARVDGDVLSVMDLKTGRGQARGSLGPPEKSGQLLSLAWILGGVASLSRPDWRPSRVRLSWWTTAEREDDVEDAEIRWDDVEGWVESRLRPVVVSALAAAEHEPSTALRLRRGSHCTHCRAFWACPAQGGALRRLSGTKGNLAELGTCDLARLWDDLQAGERIVQAAKKSLNQLVRLGDVDLGDGRELRSSRTTQTRVDPVVAAEVLGDRFLDCATVSVTQEGIRQALGSDAAKAQVEAIDRAGGLLRAQTQPFMRVYKKV